MTDLKNTWIAIAPDRNYTIKEACLFLGVHRCTIYDYIHHPERPLPFIRIHTDKRGILFRGSDLIAYKEGVSREEDASSRTALVNRGLSLNLPSCGTQFHWFQGRPANTDLPSASASWQAKSHASVRMASISLTACRKREGATAPDRTIHSEAQVSGSMASTKDSISFTRLLTLPSFISAVKVNGTPLKVFRWKSKKSLPSLY